MKSQVFPVLATSVNGIKTHDLPPIRDAVERIQTQALPVLTDSLQQLSRQDPPVVSNAVITSVDSSTKQILNFLGAQGQDTRNMVMERSNLTRAEICNLEASIRQNAASTWVELPLVLRPLMEQPLPGFAQVIVQSVEHPMDNLRPRPRLNQSSLNMRTKRYPLTSSSILADSQEQKSMPRLNGDASLQFTGVHQRA